VNYEQSLVNMINTVPLKDYVGQLVTSILQIYMGNVGIEDGEQKNRNESKVFIPHALIIKLHKWPLLLFLVNQRTAYNGKNCKICLLYLMVPVISASLGGICPTKGAVLLGGIALPLLKKRFRDHIFSCLMQSAAIEKFIHQHFRFLQFIVVCFIYFD
jgi:hypothetical protein